MSELLFDLSLTVSSAKLSGTTAFFKPDPYVEVVVDGGPPNKTEYQKSTYNPKWGRSVSTVWLINRDKITRRTAAHCPLMSSADPNYALKVTDSLPALTTLPRSPTPLPKTPEA